MIGQFTKESSQIGYEADQPHTHTPFQLCCVAISIMVILLQFFPATLWFKAMENISHLKLIYIIMNCSLTLESVLAKEDVDHSHVFLPGIVGSWTHLRETQKRIRFFCCPSVWKFLLYQLIFCGNSKEIIEPTTCTYIKGYFYKTWREKLQPLVVSWLGCHSILSFGRLICFWCSQAKLSCCLLCSTHLPPFYQIVS